MFRMQVVSFQLLSIHGFFLSTFEFFFGDARGFYYFVINAGWTRDGRVSLVVFHGVSALTHCHVTVALGLARGYLHPMFLQWPASGLLESSEW